MIVAEDHDIIQVSHEYLSAYTSETKLNVFYHSEQDLPGMPLYNE